MPRKKIDRKDKKLHREFAWLAESEYVHLCQLLGKEKTEWWIDELNLAIGSKGDPYISHYYTIQNWARRAKNAAPSPTSPSRGEATASRRAADKVLEELKHPSNNTMPSFEPRTDAAIRTIMIKRKTRWSDLREMRHDTTYMEEIHADVMKEYGN